MKEPKITQCKVKDLKDGDDIIFPEESNVHGKKTPDWYSGVVFDDEDGLVFYDTGGGIRYIEELPEVVFRIDIWLI